MANSSLRLKNRDAGGLPTPIRTASRHRTLDGSPGVTRHRPGQSTYYCTQSMQSRIPWIAKRELLTGLSRIEQKASRYLDLRVLGIFRCLCVHQALLAGLPVAGGTPAQNRREPHGGCERAPKEATERTITRCDGRDAGTAGEEAQPVAAACTLLFRASIVPSWDLVLEIFNLLVQICVE